MNRSRTISCRGEVAANHPGIARDRFIGLINSIAIDDEGIPVNPGQGIDYRIPSENRRPAFDVA